MVSRSDIRAPGKRGSRNPGVVCTSFRRAVQCRRQNGGAELINGAMVDYYVPQAGAVATKLDVSTKEFLDGMQKSDTNMKVERSQSVTVGGKPALRTTHHDQDIAAARTGSGGVPVFGCAR